MRDYIEERAEEIGQYIVESGATVRQTAKKFGVSKSTVHKDDPNYKESADIKWNFTKFLVNKKGQVVARFEPTTSFDVIAKAIEEWLNF